MFAAARSVPLNQYEPDHACRLQQRYNVDRPATFINDDVFVMLLTTLTRRVYDEDKFQQ